MSGSIDIKRFMSRAKAINFVVDQFILLANQSIAQKSIFNIAVSGGTTPIPFFKELVRKASNCNDWSKVNFFWVDERWASYEDKENNFGEAMRAGLNQLPANFYPFQTILQSAELAIEAYHHQVENAVGTTRAFDFILLGAGRDAHTASIFYSNISEAQSRKVAFVTTHPDTGQIRMSITFTTIAKANSVFVILLGEEKSKVLDTLIVQNSETNSPIQIAVAISKNPIIVTDIND
jgi:6-phosphogluconolactonase